MNQYLFHEYTRISFEIETEEGRFVKSDDEEIPNVTQMRSILSNAWNPLTKALLGYVNIFFEGYVFEMDRESFFSEEAWTHEFTELTLAKMMDCHCDKAYPLCRCDRDCTVTILRISDENEIRFPICHFVSGVITSCNFPNYNGYEKMDGDRLWNLTMEQRKKE